MSVQLFDGSAYQSGVVDTVVLGCLPTGCDLPAEPTETLIEPSLTTRSEVPDPSYDYPELWRTWGMVTTTIAF